ncbi:hypothetical protein V2J09_002773 [Rumex salicifolius]
MSLKKWSLSDQQYHGCGRVMNSFENHLGFDIAANNAVGSTNFPLESNVSSHRLELQPPENCLENYFLYNQTVDRSQMMFHPVIPQQFAYPGYNAYPTMMENNVENYYRNDVEKEISSPFTEDPDEINALLSLDNEQELESEEEEVSTARTNGYDGSSSPDSCCNYSTKSKKVKFSPSGSSHGEGSSSSCNNERKRKKMQKMMNVLRGIVPGGQRLSTTAVLDEAVKYLKCLKVEVEQNGVDDARNHA